MDGPFAFQAHGEELAVSVEVDSIFIIPSKVEAPEKSAKLLADVLSLNRKEIRRKIHRRIRKKKLLEVADPKKRVTNSHGQSQ